MDWVEEGKENIRAEKENSSYCSRQLCPSMAKEVKISPADGYSRADLTSRTLKSGAWEGWRREIRLGCEGQNLYDVYRESSTHWEASS